jgi:hypothetical protein
MARPGPQPLDLTGQRHGRLVAVSCLGMVDGYRSWACDCDCGRRGVSVKQANLRSGNSRSCGCLRHSPPERQGARAASPVRHRVLELHQQGTPIREIARQLEVSYQRVWQILKEARTGQADPRVATS